jgi:peptidyl-dipeptidase Dcp
MTTVETNPLLQTSALPYQLPDYAAIRPEHYLPAFRRGFEEQRAEIRGITMVRSMPTFENTMEALERSGALLDRVAHAFYTVSSADATPAIQEVDEELAPLMAAHQDAILLDSALYWRVCRLQEGVDDRGLTPEQHRLVQRWHREMTLVGAALDDAAKARLAALNQQLSSLSITFEKNLLADTNDLAVEFDDPAELDGLSSGELSAAARAAAERGLDGTLLLTLPL